MMLGHYGWIMTFDEIDHPDVGKTAGRVYVHKRDVVMDEKTGYAVSLAQGDVVSFYLYSDDQGLGAEHCQLEQRGLSADADEFVPVVDSYHVTGFRAEADDFVPGACPPSWNVDATEFVPTPSVDMSSCFNAQAAEFVPSKVIAIDSMVQDVVSSSIAPNPNAVSINLAFFSDDESDDESSVASNDDFSGIDGDNEISDKESSGDESVLSFHYERDIEWSSRLNAVVLNAPLKSPRASSVDDSTSVGGSDAETDDMTRCTVRAPPGLSLPPGFRAPPGLTLPVLAA